MISFTNLKTPRNTSTGLSTRVLIALVEWFTPTGIKSPGAWVTPGDDVIIYDDHDFLPGKGFITCQLAPEKNSYDAKMMGDTGFNKFANEVKLMIPGSYAEAHELLADLQGKACIILIQDANCLAGNWYQIGTACIPARIASTFTTGTQKDGNKGYQLAATNTAEKVYLYQGDITHYGDILIPVTTIARLTGNYIVLPGPGYLVVLNASTSTGLNPPFTYEYNVTYPIAPGFDGQYQVAGNQEVEVFNTDDLINWNGTTLKVVLIVHDGPINDTTLDTDPVDQRPLYLF